MTLAGFSDIGIFGVILLPIMIFFIRILDVSVGTIRIIFVSKDIRLFTITRIMENLHSPIHYVAYAAGFAMGNYVGISIERKLSMGNRTLRIITGKDSLYLIEALRSSGYGVTSLNGQGATGLVKIIFTIVKRSEISKVISIVKNFNPKAFYTVEEV